MKLLSGDLNSGCCLLHPTSTYTCGVIIAPRMCSDNTVYFLNIDDA